MDKMDMTSILKKQKCYICGFYLSVAPIMLGRVDSKHMYKCGRCQEIELTHSICNRNLSVDFYRLYLLEDFAKHLSFPCSHSSCKEIIQWERVQQHEVNCPHKTIKCPMYSYKLLNQTCEDIIHLNQLLVHFEAKHKNFIFKNNSTVVVNNSHYQVFIITENRIIFIMYILPYGEIAVLSTIPSSYTKFDVQVFLSEDDSFSANFNNLPVSSFEERLHCFKCMLRKCSANHHVFSTANLNNRVITPTSILKNSLFNNLTKFLGKVRYRITIKADESEQEDTSNTRKKINKDALKKTLTCHYCTKYLTSPIFTCSTGHTVCEDCKVKFNACPTCRTPTDAPSLTRCFALESIASNVELYCVNEGNGCTFKGNTQQIILHESYCNLCNVAGNPNIES